jgi:hypothetical protein
MTPEEQTQTLRREVWPWVDRAAALVDRRFADARAHASAGRTDAAKLRVQELAYGLIRHVADARRTFYHTAFSAHRGAGLDPSVHQLDLGPTVEGENAAAGVPILDRRYDRDFLDLAADASAALESAVLADEPEFVDLWQAEHSGRFNARAAAELSTAQIAIHHAVGAILVKPELR